MIQREPIARLARLLVASFVLSTSAAFAQDADADPEARDSTPPPASADPRFLREVEKHFRAWDRDGSGSLSVDEIELAVHDPRVNGTTAAAAASLRRAVRAHRELAPLTLAKVEGSKGHAARPPYEAMFAAALARIERAPRELFTADAPRVDRLAQGRLGDCFLLVSLGTCAARDPERLRSIMKAHADGTVRVRFGDGHDVAIAAPTDAEVALGASTSDTGVWANVYEKAVGTILMGRQAMHRNLTPLAQIGGGGSPADPLEILTGHEVKRHACDPYRHPRDRSGASTADLAPLRRTLRAAFADRRLVVGGVGDKGDRTGVPGLYFAHSYGVVDYDPRADVVTFWNPMGNKFTPKGPEGLAHGYATEHGLFRVPLKEAVIWFDSFSVETGEHVESHHRAAARGPVRH